MLNGLEMKVQLYHFIDSFKKSGWGRGERYTPKKGAVIHQPEPRKGRLLG